MEGKMFSPKRFEAMVFISVVILTVGLLFSCGPVGDSEEASPSPEVSPYSSASPSPSPISSPSPSPSPIASPIAWEHEDPPEITGSTPNEPPVGEMGYIEPGDSNIFIWADIVTPAGIIRGGQVLIDAGGHIVYVGADASGSALYAGATKIICKYGLLSPGFIDGRRHITYGGNYPANTGTERFNNRLEWLRGLNGHVKIIYQSGHPATYDEIRQVMGGTVSAINPSGSDGFIRNFIGRSEGLAAQDAAFETYPLGNSSGFMSTNPKEYLDVDTSLTSSIPNNALGTGIVVAEGINLEAHAEFITVSDTVNGLIDALGPKSVIVSGTALKSADFQKMVQRGASLVWTPRSDLYIFGDTARVTTFASLGGNIALGSYWTPTGSTNMLREIKAAWWFNENRLDGRFSNKEILDMATINGAKAYKVDGEIGETKVGLLADLVLYDSRGHTGYLGVIDAEPSDVCLVLRGGKTLYGDADLVPTMPDYNLATDWETLTVGGVSKMLATPREISTTTASFDAGYYPLPLVDGAPADEPSIIPMRTTPNAYSSVSANDSDGDGILSEDDNAPNIFNPIRPIDGGTQTDSDGDGIGDEGDPTPFGEL